MIDINETFDLAVSTEIVEACYLMPISRKNELGKKMLKTTIKEIFNIEDRTVE